MAVAWGSPVLRRSIGVVLLVSGCAGSLASRGDEVTTVDEMPPDTFAGLSVEFFGVPLGGAQDVVFVVERSRSMRDSAPDLQRELRSFEDHRAPSKMEAVRAELVRTIAALPDGTRFNIVFFDGEVSAFRREMAVLDADVRAQAASFVRGTEPGEADAATPALREALRLAPQRIVFLSDGLAAAEESRLVAEARRAARRGVRFDTVGLGVDREPMYFRVAQESGGMTVFR
jgi:hypothetical protein